MHKKSPVTHEPLYFNNSFVISSPNQRHLGLVLDSKLSFRHHISLIIAKANKGIGLIKRLYAYVPRNTLLCIYKSYIRPLLDYADIIYDQPHNASLCDKIESVQYNAALAITGAIRGTSRDRLYQELGLESLSDRRWYHRLVHFFKIVKGFCPEYLTSLLPPKQFSYNDGRNNLYRKFRTTTDYFSNSFFPYCVNEWNSKLVEKMKNVRSISKFKG